MIWLVTKSPIKLQKKSSQNNSETDSQVDKKSIVVPEDNELRLIQYYNNGISKKNTANQPSKFRTKYWVEVNDDSRGTYNTKSHWI